ncbi:hypothetical protein RAS2_29080 [Phycisphaerae bacterium RAS2]|nr:hypothetical protein RAS2_29080 [Phycisphaerae bacterium RAS2]
MGRIEQLADRYERHIAPLWQRNLAGAERAIFVVYPKEDERRMRAHRHEFEIRTRNAGHKWKEFDLTGVFSAWLAADEYRDAFFECPEDLELKLEREFAEFVSAELRTMLTADDVDDQTVVGIFGAATLYGFARLSDVLSKVEADIRGRLLLFFPGEYDNKNYRLLDARDGWNYMAVPITLHSGDIDQ